MLFPDFRFSRIDSPCRFLTGSGEMIDDGALVGLEQVEKESEEGCLAGSVVAHESQDVTIVNRERWNVAGASLAEMLLEMIYLKSSLSSKPMILAIGIAAAMVEITCKLFFVLVIILFLFLPFLVDHHMFP